VTEISREQQIPTYKNVVEFVENYLSVVYRRQVSDLSDTVWCPEWWNHPEAMARLDAVWRAWEHLRQDGATGMSVWFLDHADKHMAVLLDPKGPFKYCSVRNGHKDMLIPLPFKSPPREMFSNPSDNTEPTGHAEPTEDSSGRQVASAALRP
jgi:hypothetical protein